MDPKTKPQPNIILELTEILIQVLYRSLHATALGVAHLFNRSDVKFLNKLSLIFSIDSTQNDKNRITVDDLNTKFNDFSQLDSVSANKNTSPIGINLKTGKPYFLYLSEINQHVAIAGATGEGKTTLLISSVRHAIEHGQPIIIIDPKGDEKSVNTIKQIAEFYGSTDKFKLFSLSHPEKSFAYNFFKIGTPEQIKSKFLESFDLNHEYYGSIASEFLGSIFDLFFYVYPDSEITLDILLKYLSSNKELGVLQNDLRNQPESSLRSHFLDQVQNLQSIDKKDLRGLISQINALNLSEFRGVLNNVAENSDQIDLYQSLSKSEILYFQMNTPGYADIAKRVARLIIQDLKLVTNMIQSNILQKKYEFCRIHIDEAGSFVTQSFAEFLKMVRDASVGVHVYFQGIADFKSVSPEFSDQILGNTKVKIIFRQAIHVDVETWSMMAGTNDSKVVSKQTADDGFGNLMTGMGNIHEAKKMIVEFDVFKRLKTGEAIVINNGRGTVDLIKTWQQNSKYFSKKVTILLKKSDIFDQKTSKKHSKYYKKV